MALDSKVDLLRQKVESDHQSLREILSNLSMCLQEHKQHTTAELAHLQTSLNSTNSKLDSLTATASQLSSDHQEIQTNISDVQCMDTQQSLQLHENLHNNFTQQLEKIQNDVTFIREQYWCGGTAGWRRAVYLDMTDPNITCPSGWNMTGYSKRTCGRTVLETLPVTQQPSLSVEESIIVCAVGSRPTSPDLLKVSKAITITK